MKFSFTEKWMELEVINHVDQQKPKSKRQISHTVTHLWTLTYNNDDSNINNDNKGT
jgi:hypothetical protein